MQNETLLMGLFIGTIFGFTLGWVAHLGYTEWNKLKKEKVLTRQDLPLVQQERIIEKQGQVHQGHKLEESARQKIKEIKDYFNV